MTLLLFRGEWQQMITPYLLALAGSCAVLAANFFWPRPADESGHRRLVLCGIGLALGLFAVWLDGFELPWLGADDVDSLRPVVGPVPDLPRHPFYDRLYDHNHSIPVLAGYLAYFGLLFLAIRWWRLAERPRPQRLDMRSVLAVAFWAYLLLFLLPTTAIRQEAFLTMIGVAVVTRLAGPLGQPAPVRDAASPQCRMSEEPCSWAALLVCCLLAAAQATPPVPRALASPPSRAATALAPRNQGIGETLPKGRGRRGAPRPRSPARDRRRSMSGGLTSILSANTSSRATADPASRKITNTQQEPGRTRRGSTRSSRSPSRPCVIFRSKSGERAACLNGGSGRRASSRLRCWQD
ncbi:MAG: hypothetical protein U0793_23020 [Gemmataceae bacterium]